MKNCSKCILCKITSFLVIFGAIHWGLFGVLGIDLVAKVAGEVTPASIVFYALIGIAGVLKLLGCFFKCPGCKKDASSDAQTGCCAK